MTLIMGFYGSSRLELGPNCSRLITSNPLFVQSIQVSISHFLARLTNTNFQRLWLESRSRQNPGRFYTASLNHLRWTWRPLGTKRIARPCPQIFTGQDISSLVFFRRLNCKSNNCLLQEWMYFLNKGSTIRVQYTI